MKSKASVSTSHEQVVEFWECEHSPVIDRIADHLEKTYEWPEVGWNDWRKLTKEVFVAWKSNP